MAEYERSATVHGTPAVIYAYVADPKHLPGYVAGMVQAAMMGGDHLHVAADVRRGHEEGNAMFRANPASRRLEWGSDDHPDYHGWLVVADGDANDTSRVTIHISTRNEDDRVEIDAALQQTLANLEAVLSHA
jgi:hypothetical protein